MIQAVLDEGGIIDKIIGDAVMAIFGVLPSNLPPPVLAVKAAFRMMDDIKNLNRDRILQTQDTFEVSIGIATGQVFLGILGSKSRRTLSAIGHYVNLASRLEGQARNCEVLIDKNTFREIPDGAKYFSKTRLTLKGIREPVEVYSHQPDSCGVRDDGC
jgi:class 3 adenylate cyclase